MEKELNHVGVLGMRWGHRKGDTADKKRERKVAKMTRTPGKLHRNINKLTQPEIDKAMARLRMHREIRGLKRDEMQKGSQYVNAILAYGSSAAAVYTLVTSPAGKALVEKFKTAYDKI